MSTNRSPHILDENTSRLSADQAPFTRSAGESFECLKGKYVQVLNEQGQSISPQELSTGVPATLTVNTVKGFQTWCSHDGHHVPKPVVFYTNEKTNGLDFSLVLCDCESIGASGLVVHSHFKHGLIHEPPVQAAPLINIWRIERPDTPPMNVED